MIKLTKQFIYFSRHKYSSFVNMKSDMPKSETNFINSVPSVSYEHVKMFHKYADLGLNFSSSVNL